MHRSGAGTWGTKALSAEAISKTDTMITGDERTSPGVVLLFKVTDTILFVISLVVSVTVSVAEGGAMSNPVV